jgi:hypothetical protein
MKITMFYNQPLFSFLFRTLLAPKYSVLNTTIHLVPTPHKVSALKIDGNSLKSYKLQVSHPDVFIQYIQSINISVKTQQFFI